MITIMVVKVFRDAVIDVVIVDVHTLLRHVV